MDSSESRTKFFLPLQELITDVEKVLPIDLPECMICLEEKANITFLPCGHNIACHGKHSLLYFHL